ncbi:MAG: RimK family alpha-L-glutamate ligase [archaeon]|nr:RimK family alpha-L-glutamate ligase [archaeon]
MTGWIVYNGSLLTEKMLQPIEQLRASARRLGETLVPRTNDSIIPVWSGEGISLDGDLPDYIVFWDKDVRLARALESMGIRLYNRADAIEVCDDKSLTYMALARRSIPIPRTVVSPLRFVDGGDIRGFAERTVERLGLPLVAKDCFGSFGQQVSLVDTTDDLVSLISSKPTVPMVFQEFVSESRGRDVRINIVGGRFVAAMGRQACDGDFRSNITNGGSMFPYSPSEEEISVAIDSCKALSLDFGGVDLMFGKDGPVVCEVNSNAHMKNVLDCTGIDVSEHIMGYILERES